MDDFTSWLFSRLLFALVCARCACTCNVPAKGASTLLSVMCHVYMRTVYVTTCMYMCVIAAVSYFGVKSSLCVCVHVL